MNRRGRGNIEIRGLRGTTITYKINYKDISYNSGNMANISIITTNEVEPFKIMSLYCTFVTFTVHHACMLSHFSHVHIFCNLMDCSPPGCSVQGILQARTLEWVTIFSSRGSSQTRDRIQVSCIAGRFLPSEPPGMLPTMPKVTVKTCFCLGW